MRVWHLTDLPLSGCIQTGNMIEGAIKGYEEEKTKYRYSFCDVKKGALEGYFYVQHYKMYKVALVTTSCIKAGL